VTTMGRAEPRASVRGRVVHITFDRDDAWAIRDLAVKADLEDVAEAIRSALDRRRQQLKRRRTFHCLSRSCGSFVSRPSAICSVCGNDPVTYNGDRLAFDRAHGWED
jgi:hypothetical protein